MRKDMQMGFGAGALTIGIGALCAAFWLGSHRYHSLQGTAVAEGVLVEWIDERTTDANHNVTNTHSPVVRFKSASGEFYKAKGLGGSQSDIEPGSAVKVRYRISNPNDALIDDFQNIWGGTFAFSLFGIIPSGMGILLIALKFAETSRRRPKTPPEISPARTKVAENLTLIGNLMFFGSFGFAIFMDDVLKSIGRTFLTIGVACVVHTIAALVRDSTDWQAPAMFFFIGTGFLLFGFGGVMMS